MFVEPLISAEKKSFKQLRSLVRDTEATDEKHGEDQSAQSQLKQSEAPNGLLEKALKLGSFSSKNLGNSPKVRVPDFNEKMRQIRIQESLKRQKALNAKHSQYHGKTNTESDQVLNQQTIASETGDGEEPTQPDTLQVLSSDSLDENDEPLDSIIDSSEAEDFIQEQDDDWEDDIEATCQVVAPPSKDAGKKRVMKMVENMKKRKLEDDGSKNFESSKNCANDLSSTTSTGFAFAAGDVIGALGGAGGDHDDDDDDEDDVDWKLPDDSQSSRIEKLGVKLAQMAEDSMEADNGKLTAGNLSMTEASCREMKSSNNNANTNTANNVVDDHEDHKQGPIESFEFDRELAQTSENRMVHKRIIDSDDEDDSETSPGKAKKSQKSSMSQEKLKKTEFLVDEAEVEEDEYMNMGGLDGDLEEAEQALRKELATFIDEDEQVLANMSIEEMEERIKQDEEVAALFEQQMRQRDLQDTKMLVKDITTGKILEKRKHQKSNSNETEFNKFGRAAEDETENNAALRELDDAEDYGLFGDIIARYNTLKREVNRRKGLRKRRRNGQHSENEEEDAELKKENEDPEDSDNDWTNEKSIGNIQLAPGEIIETDLETLQTKIKRREILDRIDKNYSRESLSSNSMLDDNSQKILERINYKNKQSDADIPKTLAQGYRSVFRELKRKNPQEMWRNQNVKLFDTSLDTSSNIRKPSAFAKKENPPKNPISTTRKIDADSRMHSSGGTGRAPPPSRASIISRTRHA